MRLELHGAAEIIVGSMKNLQTSHDPIRAGGAPPLLQIVMSVSVQSDPQPRL